MTSERLSDRHVVVTGAGTGIGRAVAQRLAAAGARLTLLARDEARLRETAEGLSETGERSGGGPVHCASLDIRDGEAVDRRFAEAAAAQGPVFALVANSGIGGPNAPGPEDRFDDLVATNLTGTYACCRAAERHLAPGPGPRHLVLVSSILGRIGVPGYTGYCASKAGLLGLARALSAELAPREIQVNAVCPGWVDTEMARAGLRDLAAGLGISEDEARAQAMGQVPLGRMSAPEDVAGLIAYLLSPDARGITGQGIDMNGGAFMI